jgi:hypothetical protein
MKTTTLKISIVFLIAIGISSLLGGCEKDEMNTNSLLKSEGLSLYWNHQIFGENGRGYVFEFYEAQRLENLYRLVFEYRIDKRKKNIAVYLNDKADRGKCPYFPTPGESDGLCISKGGFFISEDLLEEGNYTFTLNTAGFKVHSNLVIQKEKLTLDIPENEYFSCSIVDVFPTPKGLLYGSVIFTGEENTRYAHDFFENLNAIGLKDTVVTNSPFNLSVDENGKPKDTHWEPDKHSLAFQYSMNVNFYEIFELSKQYFNQYDLNIYLFTTNGDQARLSKNDGIFVVYAEQ